MHVYVAAVTNNYISSSTWIGTIFYGAFRKMRFFLFRSY